MSTQPRFSNSLLLRITVWLTALILLVLHFVLEIEMFGVLSWFISTMFLFSYELPLSARKQEDRNRRE